MIQKPEACYILKSHQRYYKMLVICTDEYSYFSLKAWTCLCEMILEMHVLKNPDTLPNL